MDTHIKSIFQSDTRVEIRNSCETAGSLDFEITEEGLKIASTNLMSNKAPGIDSVMNKMVNGILKIYSNIIISLFNTILNIISH